MGRLARATARALDPVDPWPWLQWRAAEPRRAVAYHHGDRRAVRTLGRRGASRVIDSSDTASACVAGCSGSRHAEARFLGRARLVRHPYLRPARDCNVGALARFDAAGAARAGGADLPRHPARVPSTPRDLCGRRLGIPDPAVGRAGASRAALQPAHGTQLGGWNDLGVGTVHDDLVALSGLTPK